MKLKRSLVEMGQKRDEILGQLAAQAVKEKEMQARMSHLKRMLEREIAGQYKGRQVNVIGEINNLLG